MRLVSILGEILPVVGTVGLLGLWLYQQTELERRAGELRRLASARGVFQTYQSNNAVFNSINEVAGGKAPSANQIRVFQIYNYELGLRAIEEVIPAREREDVPASMSAYDSTTTVDAKMANTQIRLEKLQTKLAARERALQAEAEHARTRYLWSYVALSALSILGAICKVADKLSPAAG